MKTSQARREAATLLRTAIESAYFKQNDNTDDDWQAICKQMDLITRSFSARIEKLAR